MKRLVMTGFCVVLFSVAALGAGLDVRLTVAERDGENRVMQPVTSGMPLPEGVYY